jgi:hypothetical protein
MSMGIEPEELRSAGLDKDPRTCRVIALSEIDDATLLEGLALWRSLCGGRKYPPRSAVTPRILKPLLRNTMLLRVIDGGRDYEYRIVGDAYVMAHGVSFQGKCWSQIENLSPGFHAYVKPIYDKIVRAGEPLATRGWIERGADSTGHVYCEYIYLPLGASDGSVDHILVFAVYIRRDGLEHVGGSPSGNTGA